MEDSEDRFTIFLDYLSKNSGRKMTAEDKCQLVIDRVRSGKVIVVEGGLNSQEEAILIEKSMSEIDHEKFLGVEIYTNSKSAKERSRFKRPENRVTVIAPASTELSVKTF